LRDLIKKGKKNLRLEGTKRKHGECILIARSKKVRKTNKKKGVGWRSQQA